MERLKVDGEELTTFVGTSMQRLVIALAALLLSCSSDPGAGNPDAPDGIELLRSSLQREKPAALSSGEREQLGKGSREFALALYEQAAKDADGNVFLSPYSVSVALAMTYAGARADTKTEMTSALHFSLAEPQLHSTWNSVDLALQARGEELVSEDS